MIKDYMVEVYALLVKTGTWAITSDNNPKKLTVIPETYQIKVAEYLAKQAK